MGTRTVTGTIYHLDGTAWAAGEVKFELLEPFETATETYPRETHTETLDASGQFSITLGVPDTGTAHYKVETPDHMTYKFYLAAGAATTLESLLTIASSSVSQDAVQTLIDAHAASYHLPSYYTGLAALTSPTLDDILPIIDAPGGTPAIKKITINDLLKGVIILVAANSASADQKKYADYICDGIADNIEIQAAIDFLSPNGGYVRLIGGLFTIADAGSGYCLQIDQSNIHLDIQAGTTVKLKDNEISGAEICNLIKIGDGTNVYSNILIDGGGVVDGNEDNNASAGSITAGAEIYISGPVTNVIISGLSILNASRDAICISGLDTANRASNIKIENCIIDNPAEGIVWGKANNVRIIGNTITNTREQDGAEPIDDCDGWWISKNYFSGIHASNSAIDIFSNTTLNEHGYVLNNIIVNNGANYDIQISNAAGGPISDVLVSGNILDGGGIIVGAGSGPAATVNRIVIEKNIVSEGSAGIWLGQYAANVSVIGNVVYGCDINGIICVTGCTKPLIANNRVFDNGNSLSGETDQVGIKLSGSTNPMAIGNICYDTRVGAARTQFYPILAQSTTNALIADNYFTNNIANYVPLDASTGYIVRNNHGMTNEKQGAAANKSDGGTIGHGLYTTPTVGLVSGSVAGEIVTVTSMDANNITIAIKKHDGSAGTAQTIYWRAYV